MPKYKLPMRDRAIDVLGVVEPKSTMKGGNREYYTMGRGAGQGKSPEGHYRYSQNIGTIGYKNKKGKGKKISVKETNLSKDEQYLPSGQMRYEYSFGKGGRRTKSFVGTYEPDTRAGGDDYYVATGFASKKDERKYNRFSRKVERFNRKAEKRGLSPLSIPEFRLF